MAGTYTYSGDPTSSLLDETRYWLQDLATPWLASNEEVNFALSKSSQSPQLAASQLCRIISIRFAQRGTVSVDGISINYTERSRSMAAQADALDMMARAAGFGPLPYSGGTSRDVDSVLTQDTDSYQGVMAALSPSDYVKP